MSTAAAFRFEADIKYFPIILLTLANQFSVSTETCCSSSHLKALGSVFEDSATWQALASVPGQGGGGEGRTPSQCLWGVVRAGPAPGEECWDKNEGGGPVLTRSSNNGFLVLVS